LIDKWAYFFRETGDLEKIPPALAEGPFREALEIAHRCAFTAYEWEVYDRNKIAEQDARGALSLARKEGQCEAKRQMLLKLFKRVGLEATDKELEQIAACGDPAKLDQWLDEAFAAKTVADILASGSRRTF
jgi:hypothetical protein